MTKMTTIFFHPFRVTDSAAFKTAPTTTPASAAFHFVGDDIKWMPQFFLRKMLSRSRNSLMGTAVCGRRDATIRTSTRQG